MINVGAAAKTSNHKNDYKSRPSNQLRKKQLESWKLKCVSEVQISKVAQDGV